VDFQTSFQGRKTFLQRLGIGSVDDSTVSYTNHHRPWQVMMQVFVRLYQQCRVVSPAHPFRFRARLFLLDATEMDTCATLFKWARISLTQSGVKMHVGLDHNGVIPNFVAISPMRESELTQAKTLTFPAGTTCSPSWVKACQTQPDSNAVILLGISINKNKPAPMY
jgi:putative transposase